MDPIHVQLLSVIPRARGRRTFGLGRYKCYLFDTTENTSGNLGITLQEWGKAYKMEATSSVCVNNTLRAKKLHRDWLLVNSCSNKTLFLVVLLCFVYLCTSPCLHSTLLLTWTQTVDIGAIWWWETWNFVYVYAYTYYPHTQYGAWGMLYVITWTVDLIVHYRAYCFI